MIRWLNHTADIEIEITCDRYEDVFTDFVGVLKSLLVTGEVQPLKAKKINLKETDACELLVSLGRQILIYFNANQFVPSRLDIHTAERTRLIGDLWGEPYNPSRHEFHLEVKGVTYHDLKVENDGEKWNSTVTFDV